MYVNIREREITGVQEVTLAATSTLVNVKKGEIFYIQNRGTNTAYIGNTAADCDLGWAIAANESIGPFVSKNGELYMRGTAAEKAYIMYIK